MTQTTDENTPDPIYTNQHPMAEAQRVVIHEEMMARARGYAASATGVGNSDFYPNVDRWEIASCPPGDVRQQALLNDGWEPLSVAEGLVWFKRLIRVQPI